MSDDYYQEFSPDDNTDKKENPFNNSEDNEQEMKGNAFASLALFISLLSYALCCCHVYVMIGGCVLSIGLAIVSKVVVDPQHRMRGKAVAAIVIGIVGLIFIIGSFIITYSVLPTLLQDPEFRQTLTNTLQQMGFTESDIKSLWN